MRDSSARFKDVPAIGRSGLAGSGYNNYDMFIIPDWNMVIVRLGLDQSDHQITDEEFGRFLAEVGEAVSLKHNTP